MKKRKRIERDGPRDELRLPDHGERRGKGKFKKLHRRPKRPKVFLSRGGPPFDRDFFALTLPQMVKHCPCAEGHQPIVRLHLADGAILDVAGMAVLAERFGVAAAYEGVGQDGVEHTADDLGLEAFPYDIVVRASVRSEPKQARFGFGSIAPLPEPNPAGETSKSPEEKS